MARGQTAKITLNLPKPFLRDVDNTATELSLTRTELIRSALEKYVKALAKAKLKEELIEGYKANSTLLTQTSEEFKFVDGENV